jgi:Predicted sugar phosphate isomerase
MSMKLTDSVMERRSTITADIDRLSTEDMLNVINQEDKRIADAITPCLDEITRLVDQAAAALSRGGRLVIVGAGASGRAGMLAASEFAPDGNGPVVGLIAGGPQAMLNGKNEAAYDYDRGALDLQSIGFNEKDMLLALTVGGKTPWVWGAMRHAWSLDAPIAVVTRNLQSEAAQLATLVIAPQTGAEVVAGYGDPKANAAQKLILNMLTTGLAIRSGRVYSNLRVDVQGDSTQWYERQIAIVMEAGSCSRAVAKSALESCDHHCKTAILMVLTGMDADKANALLAQNNGFVRVALQEAP